MPLHQKIWSASSPTRKSRRRRCSSLASAPPTATCCVGDYRRRSRRSLFEQHAQRSVHRAGAQAGREVPGRRQGRRLAEPRPSTRSALNARVQDGGIAEGLTALAGRGEARARSSASRVGARSREALDATVLRARLQRARQERERLVRAGIPQLLPERRTEPGHRVRVAARPAGAAGNHVEGHHHARRPACSTTKARSCWRRCRRRTGVAGADRTS